MTNSLSELKTIQLFVDLNPVVLQKLGTITRSATYSKDEIIMLEGDRNAPIFFILEGTVRVFRANPDGREQTIILLRPGAVFNLQMAFSKAPISPTSAVAMSFVRLLATDAQDFRSITAETPQLALAVLRDFSDKLNHFVGLTCDLSLRSVRGRLAQLLLSRARAADALSMERWTQEEIAAQIGTVREVVSRTLRAFVKDDLIKMDRQRIIILDPEGLRIEAEF